MQAGCCRQPPECATPAAPAVFVKDDIEAGRGRRSRVPTADSSCDKLIRQSQLNNSHISPQPGMSTSCGPLLRRMDGGWAVCGANQRDPKTSFIIITVSLSFLLRNWYNDVFGFYVREGGDILKWRCSAMINYAVAGRRRSGRARLPPLKTLGPFRRRRSPSPPLRARRSAVRN